MRENANKVVLEGYLYDLSGLEIKQVKKKDSPKFGKDFLGGTFQLALAEDENNIVSIHISFMEPVYKSGKPNTTYSTLMNAKNAGQTWLAAGKEGALKVRVEAKIDLNDFYSINNKTMVSARRIECSFVSTISSFTGEKTKSNYFIADMVITNVAQIEENEEKHVNEHVEIRGAIFNFRNELLPMSFSVTSPAGMDYFSGIETPMYTAISGYIKNNRVEGKKLIESAFGGPIEVDDSRSFTSWEVDWAASNPYEFDEDSTETMTIAELTKAQQNREIKLAEIKSQGEAREKELSDDLPFGDTPKTSGPAKTVPKGSFNF